MSLFSTQAKFLDLPRSLSSKAVYHKETYQLDDFSCGYNVLFNACNLEKVCSFPNKFYQYPLFEKTCKKYTALNKLQPKSSASNHDIDCLARVYLGTQPLYVLGFNQAGDIQPLFSDPTEITHPMGISQAEIDRRLKKAIEQRSDDLFESIKDRLLKSRAAYYTIIHFACIVQDEDVPHVLLVSLVQNRSGKALYIFDNLNRKISDRSPTKCYIDFLCEMFAINKKNQFQGPTIPDLWSTMPKRRSLITSDCY